ncbi:MAG TPA: RHS repeat-associated core domain-containing protein [Candidatus Saccharimonadales bacterium]|nr:RHS repeat-associated core domain-containing protein [Candidatus Saccharimonadales bacterium]
MKKKILLSVLACAVFLSPLLIAFESTNPPVGAIAGDFLVDADGGASYTVPITVPPGTAGKNPSVALAYNKSTGNTLAGIGFSVTGLSVVHRCGQSIALDGAKGGVQYDSNDRFCLDGQRLLAVNGTYGADGTEYRTERETFNRVFSYGTQGAGPQSFKVTTKDGGVVEYGATNDARIEASGKATVRLWAVSKVQDIMGNYYSVTYTEDNADGDYRPDRIDYTGNSSTGLTPYNSIRFAYGTRPDIPARYEGGSVQKVIRRLVKIETYTDNTIVRTYNLSYDNNGTSGASRLISLQECGSDGGCLPVTAFGYQQGSSGFTADPDAGSYVSGMTWKAGGNYWGDVNGDGRGDFVYLQDGTSNWRVMLSNGTSLGTDTIWGTNAHGLKWDTGDFPRLVDINADGKDDIIYHQAGTGTTWRVLLSTGTSFAADSVWGTTTHGISSYGGSHQFFLVDVNGDSKTDLVYLEDNTATWRAALSSPNGNTLGPDVVLGTQTYGTVSAGGYHAHYWADANGDGKSDLVYQQDGTSTWRVMLSNGTSLGADTAWGGNTQSLKWDNGDGPRVLDVNADGKADIVYYQAGTGTTWRVLHSTGNSFATDSVWGTTTNGISSYGGGHQFFLVDADGDSKPDLTYLEDNTATWRAALSSKGDGNNLGPDAILGTQSHGTVSGGGHHAHYWTDFDGNGKSDLAYLRDGTTTFKIGRSPSPVPNLLTTVSNGLGATIDLTYKPLTDSTVYTKGSDAVYPYQDVQNATHVVSRVMQSDGLGEQYAINYQYTGAKMHLTGPGWVGFRIVKNTDERNGLVATTEYNQDYQAGLHGTPTVAENKLNNVVVKRHTTFWTGIDMGNGRKFMRPDGTQEEHFEADGTAVSCAKVDNAYTSFDATGNYGNYGLPSTVVSKTAINCGFADALIKTTTNTYTHDTAQNILGKLTRAQVMHQAPGQPTITHTTSSTYTPQGLTATETTEPDSATLWSKTSYTYDSFGNRTHVTNSGPDITNRTSTSTYDSRGRFEVGATNAAGHVTVTAADPKWGSPLTQTDANGLITSFEYDGFGRKTKETRPDNSKVTTVLAICNSSNPCPGLGNGVAPSYMVTTEATGKAPTKEYYDMLDRGVRAEGQSLHGAAVYEDTWFDSLGRVQRKSKQYFASQSPVWIVHAYDSLNRVVSVTEPGGKVTATTYAGSSTIETTSGTGVQTRSRTTVKNAIGHPVSITDSLYPDKSTAYTYDAVGNLIKVTDPAGNQTALAYDVRGKKTQMSDPDMGTWHYAYNSLGELVSQTDSKNQTQTASYDALGRIKTRTTAEGISTWAYDTADKGIGKPASTSSSSGYAETYTYDAYGRPDTTTAALDGQNYTTTTAYDSAGRVNTLTYPTGFAVKNVYNANGQLSEIRNNQTNALYWQANEADARGRLVRETFGNGLVTQKTYDPAKGTLSSIATTGISGSVQNLEYTFDVLGNLLSRTDHTQAITESFQYDTLNRLTAVSGPSNKNFQYNEIGNITYKSDVGSYTYPASGIGSIRPHAVTQVAGVLQNNYTYDANGNMTSGGGRTITYTSFNKPSQITVGGATSILTYDANFNRVKKVTPSSTTVYIGKLYERVTIGTLVEHKHFINGVAVYTSRSNGTNDVRYLLKDHLGSTEAVTDENGNVLQKLSYDAHGKRRSSNWTDATGTLSAQTTKGYTGHEMDDESGLVNMNAREYDSVLGRFLQPDILVESSFGQGLNRYTYANNNPLSYTDPTGNKSLKKLIRTVVSVVVTVYCPVCGAVLNAAFVKADGGTWSQAFKAGVVSYATSYANSYIGDQYMTGKFFGEAGSVGAIAVKGAAQGVVGGASAELMGGSFSQGFKYAFGTSVLKSSLDATLKDPKAASSLKGASKGAVYKPDPAKMNDPAYVKAAEICANSDVCYWDAANVGNAEPALTADKIGQPTVGNGAFGSEGSAAMQFLAKYVPGMQALANLHDTHMGVLQRAMDGGVTFNFINTATIPVYAYAQYQAFDFKSASYRQDLMAKR